MTAIKKRLLQFTATLLAVATLGTVSAAGVDATQSETADPDGLITAAEAVDEMTWGVNFADLYIADVRYEQGNTTGYCDQAPFGLAIWYWNDGFDWLSYVDLYSKEFSISVKIPNYHNEPITNWIGGLFTIGVMTYVKGQQVKLTLSNCKLLKTNGEEINLSFMNDTYDQTTSNGPDINDFYSYHLNFDKTQLPQPSADLDGATFQADITVNAAPFTSGEAKADCFFQFRRETFDQEELTDLFLDQGVNVVRLPVTWTSFVQDEAPYTIDEAWLDAVKRQVDLIIDSGAYCILNMHNDYLMRSFVGDHWEQDWMEEEYWGYVTARFVAVWEQIAEYFKDYSQKLIFEPCNEPTMEWHSDKPYNWNQKQVDCVNELNQLFVDTVRETGGNNATRLLCLAVANYNQYDRLDGFIKPTDPADNGDGRGKYLMVQVHSYNAMERPSYETGDYDTYNYKAATDELFTAIQTFEDRTGLPVIIGEVGITHQRMDREQAPKVSYFFQQAETYGIPCLWWEDYFASDTAYWLYDKENNTWGRPEILAAIKEVVGVHDPLVKITVNGTTYQVESSDPGDCGVYAVAYDSGGKMLAVAHEARTAGSGTVDLTLALPEQTTEYNIKVFLLDPTSYMPLTEALRPGEGEGAASSE